MDLRSCWRWVKVKVSELDFGMDFCFLKPLLFRYFSVNFILFDFTFYIDLYCFLDILKSNCLQFVFDLKHKIQMKSSQKAPGKSFLTLSSYQRNRYFFLLILVICWFEVKTIYQDPPAYFNSFYCNLGTKIMAQIEDYSCLSPRIIQRGDKFALSLVEFNKVPSVSIWFKAQITSSPGVSLTGVGIRLQLMTEYTNTTMYGYMVVAIGYQTQNNWLDLVNVKLPSNSEDSEVQFPNTSGSYKYLDREIYFSSSETRLSRFSHYILFDTSFGVQTSSITEQAYIVKSSTILVNNVLVIRIATYSWVTVRTMNWGVFVLNQADKPLNAVYYSRQYSFGASYNYTISFYQGNFKLYGPNFNSKCLLGYRYFQWGLNSNPSNNYPSHNGAFTLLNSSQNNYYLLSTTSDVSQTIGFSCQFLCIADNTNIVAGEFPYLNSQYIDTLTGIIYTDSTQCPLAPTNPASKQCQRCTEVQCILCDPSMRWNCSKCINGYETNSSNQCVPCFLLYPSCSLCSPSACTQCKLSYGFSPSGQCTACSLLYPNCAICISLANDTGCTQCIATDGIYLLANGQCKICSQSVQNCLQCTPNNSNLSLICNKCAVGFCLNSLQNICIDCSLTIQNCLTFDANNCPECIPGYGITFSGRCQSCSQLYSNCTLCSSYNSGCVQCVASDTIYLLGNGQCQACSQMDPYCLQCVPNAQNSALTCNKCAEGSCLRQLLNGGLGCSSNCQETIQASNTITINLTVFIIVGVIVLILLVVSIASNAYMIRRLRSMNRIEIMRREITESRIDIQYNQ